MSLVYSETVTLSVAIDVSNPYKLNMFLANEFQEPFLYFIDVFQYYDK